MLNRTCFTEVNFPLALNTYPLQPASPLGSSGFLFSPSVTFYVLLFSFAYEATAAATKTSASQTWLPIWNHPRAFKYTGPATPLRDAD